MFYEKKITLYLYVNCDIVFIQNDRNLTKHYNVKTFYIDNLDFDFSKYIMESITPLVFIGIFNLLKNKMDLFRIVCKIMRKEFFFHSIELIQETYTCITNSKQNDEYLHDYRTTLIFKLKSNRLILNQFRITEI